VLYQHLVATSLAQSYSFIIMCQSLL